MDEATQTFAACLNFYEARTLTPNYLWNYSVDSIWSWNETLCYSHSWPFLIRWWFKACLCIHDLISSEPALPPGEHPGGDRAIIFCSVGGCHQLCCNVGLCLCASPSLSFCHYIYLLIFQWIKCPQALPWLVRSLLLSSTHPPLNTFRRTLLSQTIR